MATVVFLEPGTGATQDLTFYATTGTVASATDQTLTGSRSLKLSSGSPAAAATASRSGLLADAGRRISFWFRSDTTPAAVADILIALTSGGSSVFSIRFNTNGTLQIRPLGATVVNGSTAVTLNAWHRISFGYTITNSTTWRIDLYLDGHLEATANSNGTLSATGTDTFRFSMTAAIGANANYWFCHLFIDNGTDNADVGDYRVTYKRPNANGTNNQFTTQIGSGGSGYGSGHSPQVNELPLSTTNGWSFAVTGVAKTEEYNIEGRATGDIDLTGLSISDYMGWVYCKALNAETGQIVVNNVNTNISITTSAKLFTQMAGSTTYPAGSGTDIGLITATTSTTVSLYECGIIFAYRPSVSATDSPAAPTDTASRSAQSPSRTATDSPAALTDTATRSAQANTRTATDAPSTPTDVATRSTQAKSRTATDAPAVPTDVATRSSQSSSRTASDSPSAPTDVATRQAQAKSRTATDSPAAPTDVATRSAQAASRTATDSPGAITDIANRSAQTSTRTGTDAVVAFTDAATRSGQASSRTATDNPSPPTDIAIRATQANTRTGSDPISAPTDIATRSGSGSTRSATDAVNGPTDVATRDATSASRSASDALAALLDTATRAAQTSTRATSDTIVVLTDFATDGTVERRTATDVIAALTDVAIVIRHNRVSAIDALAAMTDVATIPSPTPPTPGGAGPDGVLFDFGDPDEEWLETEILRWPY